MKKVFFLLLIVMFTISFSSGLTTENLTSYYKLDEVSGNAADSQGFNTGIATGITYGNTGILDDAFTFTAGSTDRVETFLPTSTALTWNMWVYFTSSPSATTYRAMSNADGNEGVQVHFVGGVPRLTIGTGSSSFNIIGTFDFDGNEDEWHMITVTYDDSDNVGRIYVDGSSENSADIGANIDWGSINIFIGNNKFLDRGFPGRMDEVAIFDSRLDASQVSELYNSGAALPFPFVGDILINLDLPINDSIVSSSVAFNATLLPIPGFNLTNATLIIWDSNGDVFVTDTNNVIGDTSTSTGFIVTNLTTDNYEWNVFGSSENSTGFLSANFSEFNNTFTWVPFEVDNEIFNTNVFETSRQDFLINITTLPSVLSVDAILNYDNIRFSAETSCSSGLCQIGTALDIPLVISGESENKSFFWEISIFDGSNSFSTNITSNEQNVTRLHLEECNATFTVQTLNFTSFDETTQVAISPFMFDGTFNFWTGTGSIRRSNSISDPSTSSLQLCIAPSEETFFLDGTIEYDEATGTNYTSRNYFFQNDTISNVSEDIKLGLLLSEDSTSFILKVQDRDILPVANVLIFTQRFYPGEGVFRTVQVSETDDSGRTVGFFETETVDYRFIIKQNGQTVLITNKQKIVGEEVPFTLTFTIGEDAGSAWENFEDIDDLVSELTFNKSSNVVSFSYADTSDNFTSSRLIVSLVQYNSTSNIDVCDVTSLLSSAILTCDLTGNVTGTYIARAIIIRGSDTSLVEQIQFQIEDFTSATGNLGLLLGFFLILISAFMFKYNEIAGILMVNVTIIITNMMGLIAWGYGFISAMVAISIIILVLLER